MAKVSVTSGNVTVEAESQKELFETLASYQEVFSVAHCGGCKKTNLKFSVRRQADAKGKEHTYFELRCSDCFAKLPYGQHDTGSTLFPKKWIRWDKNTQKEIDL